MELYVPRLILVPTDLSDPAAHALRYASALGERLGAHLLVIYADSFIPPTDFTARTAGVFHLSRDAMLATAREDLRKHAGQNVSSRVPFDQRVIIGEPLDAIMAQVRESGADLVVMGTHGRTGVSRLMFGSVTEAVMRVVPVPVIAVNPTATDTADVEKVLCPVTYTPACRDALRHAAALASGPGAPLVLLRPADDDQARMGVDELNQLHGWLPVELADRCQMKLVSAANEAEQIVEAARKVHAQLIAFGVPAGRSATDSLLGTIAERVVQQSRCPVLTVNPYAARVLPNSSCVFPLPGV
ncbi:MAG TPA: universal stress protein [Thermoanaerobaculia bacterium]|nr:universal stress protein [Thermoanaerobaculia bacterium]